MSTWMLVVLIVVIGAGVVLVVAVAGTKAGRAQGYSGMGGDTVVRCSEGHLFTTVWVPGASFKSVRLGSTRYQRCPVCEKWRTVRPVPESELTEEDRRAAAETHDTRLP